MPTVTIVEIRTPLESPGPHDAPVQSDLAFVGSDRAKAMEFVAGHPDYAGRERPWCWYLYEVSLDDPRAIPHEKTVVGRDGSAYGSQKEAWDACSLGPPALR